MKAKKHFESTDDLTMVRCHIAAMLILQSKAPVHHTVLITTEVVWTDAVGTAATDGIYVYISPRFYRGLATDSQRAFLLAHEVSHIILRHPQRGHFFDKRGFFTPGVRFDHHTYNRAADYVINADCIAMGLEPIPEGCYSDDFGRNDLVDNVYAQLVSDNDQQDSDPDDQDGDQGGDQDDDDLIAEPGFDGDDQDGDQDSDQEGDQDSGGNDAQEGDQDGDSDGGNGGAGDDSESGDDADSDNGAGGSGGLPDKAGHDHHLAPLYEGTPEEQAQDAAEDDHQLGNAIDEGLDEAERTGRSVSGGVAGAGSRASGGNKSDTDWRAEIADLLRRAGDGDDTTWARIHRRRYATLGVISPSRRGALTRIGAIIDISRSVFRSQTHQFMVELAASIDELNPSDGCLVMFTNHDMYSAHEVQTGGELLDLEVPEGGGTRMQSAIDWAEANGFECDVMFCFTDGDLYGDDWERLSQNDVVVITDRVLPSIDARRAEEAGARVIVAQAA